MLVRVFGQRLTVMLAYLITFFGSALLLALSERVNKKLAPILVAIALLIPAALAGVRDETIGTDVRVYGRYFYELAARCSGFLQYYKITFQAGLSEIAFYFLNFLLSRVWEDYHCGLFVYQLITVAFVYLGIKRCNKLFSTPVALSMLLSYFLLYNSSLNAMRQCIAVAIVFYAATFLFEKRFKEYMLFTVLALCFHTSALIGLIYLPLYLFLDNSHKPVAFRQILKSVALLIVVGSTILISPWLIRKLVETGLLRAYYLNYLPGGALSQKINGLPLAGVLFHGVFLCLSLFVLRRMLEKDKQALFFLFVCFFSTFSFFATLVSKYLERIGLYFYVFEFIGIINERLVFSKRSRYLFDACILLCVFVLWYWQNIRMGYGETYPYVFSSF